ncbi:YbjN domain-containing protein [Planktothrix sp. FACHB-1355]|uniref:YbjN domain-containing protein n=1 Tax=Aerosakkonema funiforme FACHB-1375 TaxID=2949571 RepID=A0A926VJL8_9CYAN|nr:MULTISPECIES: YbjN domain-containing protein [Oscillatoriales]MBD2185141.1 YbjN domain-containing protein [Aerosakkonema funiforme FACHB-1375]MBD3558140.1 YbjN domain-containing protein [Planktothrix sp. FACHB-1355]
MTTYQPDPQTVATQTLASNELVDELLEETTEIDYVEVIQTVISSMAQEDSAMVSQTEAGQIWKFKYGTVEVFVHLTGSTDNDSLTVWSSVLKLPAKNEPQLMRKLLEMNGAETFEARFAIVNEQVVVITSRTVAELSPGEVSRAITIVATIADNNDESLQEQFGQ